MPPSLELKFKNALNFIGKPYAKVTLSIREHGAGIRYEIVSCTQFSIKLSNEIQEALSYTDKFDDTRIHAVYICNNGDILIHEDELVNVDFI